MVITTQCARTGEMTAVCQATSLLAGSCHPDAAYRGSRTLTAIVSDGMATVAESLHPALFATQ